MTTAQDQQSRAGPPTRLKPFRAIPSAKYLHECLAYSEDSGFLNWKVRPADHFKGDKSSERSANAARWNTRYAGKQAFTCRMTNGYAQGSIDGVTLLAHRVIYKMLTGEDPQFIDHIDGNRANNRGSNFRSVDPKTNGMNKEQSSANRSGITGVFFSELKNRWRSEINVDGKKKFLGYYTNQFDAVASRKSAEATYGYHENHGRAPVES